MRLLTSLIALMGLCLTSECQQGRRISDLVEQVRSSVVRIIVNVNGGILDQSTLSNLPQGIRDCFSPTGVQCIVGTGFFVNSSGDVVTAAHVAQAVSEIGKALHSAGRSSTVFVGVSFPNVDTPSVKIESSTQAYPLDLVGIDVTHDLAVEHSRINPFAGMVSPFGGTGAGGIPTAKASFVRLAVDRALDGQDVFACGFPFGSAGMVTNSGNVGSAWNSENLLTAKAAGVANSVDVYQADLRINPGNSGGPMFRVSDQAVLGVVIEERGTLDTVVPSKYVADFLSKENIAFTLSNTTTKPQQHPVHNK